MKAINYMTPSVKVKFPFRRRTIVIEEMLDCSLREILNDNSLKYCLKWENYYKKKRYLKTNGRMFAKLLHVIKKYVIGNIDDDKNPYLYIYKDIDRCSVYGDKDELRFDDIYNGISYMPVPISHVLRMQIFDEDEARFIVKEIYDSKFVDIETGEVFYERFN